MEGSYSRRKTTANAYYSQLRVDARDTFVGHAPATGPDGPNGARANCSVSFQEEAAADGQSASKAIAPLRQAAPDSQRAGLVADPDAHAHGTRRQHALRPHLRIRARQTRT